MGPGGERGRGFGPDGGVGGGRGGRDPCGADQGAPSSSQDSTCKTRMGRPGWRVVMALRVRAAASIVAASASTARTKTECTGSPWPSPMRYDTRWSRRGGAASVERFRSAELAGAGRSRGSPAGEGRASAALGAAGGEAPRSRVKEMWVTLAACIGRRAGRWARAALSSVTEGVRIRTGDARRVFAGRGAGVGGGATGARRPRSTDAGALMASGSTVAAVGRTKRRRRAPSCGGAGATDVETDGGLGSVAGTAAATSPVGLFSLRNRASAARSASFDMESSVAERRSGGNGVGQPRRGSSGLSPAVLVRFTSMSSPCRRA